MTKPRSIEDLVSKITPENRHPETQWDVAQSVMSRYKETLHELASTDFQETILERATSDLDFRNGLLEEALELMLSGDKKTAFKIINKCINPANALAEQRRKAHRKRWDIVLLAVAAVSATALIARIVIWATVVSAR